MTWNMFLQVSFVMFRASLSIGSGSGAALILSMPDWLYLFPQDAVSVQAIEWQARRQAALTRHRTLQTTPFRPCPGPLTTALA